MWQYNYSSELYHHGVKGMKWGVRKKKKVADLKSKYHSKAESAAGHYRHSVKLANRANDETLSSKERSDAARYGGWQYTKGKKFEKEANRIKKKIEKSSTINETKSLVTARQEAGRLYVKKSLPRRVAEISAEQVSRGAQFALQTALVGRPVMAIVTEHGSYKLKKQA